MSAIASAPEAATTLMPREAGPADRATTRRVPDSATREAGTCTAPSARAAASSSGESSGASRSAAGEAATTRPSAPSTCTTRAPETGNVAGNRFSATSVAT